ncbi:MAG: hypothetical protein H6779_04750 [Candidatus Nomurabacteria bacterium]|nr:hypothetical protein [Candidatus Nomurabacteria bacterium]USN87682.1 MAG: hypothetical protein H6779_04750 [Candidatus Nomurabacteria bacterium]
MDKNKRNELLDAFKERPDVLVDFIATDTRKQRDEQENIKHLAEIQREREQDINSMRKKWSFWLLVAILFVILFDSILILLLGFEFKGFGFSDERLVFAFVLEHLVKIGGLAYIVINFLFDKENGKTILQ